MRTTIILDPDVKLMLDEAMRERAISFKQAINDAVRAGLTPTRRQKRRFFQATYSMGADQHFRWDKALSTADAIGDEAIMRKLTREALGAASPIRG